MSSKVPEIIACADKNDIEGVRKCIEKGCNIDEQRQDGRSALLVACIKGYFDIVKVLVENNADVHIRNKKGGNALGHAAYRNHFEIIEYLLQHDADPNSKDNTGRNTIHIACSQGSNDVIRVLIESGKISNINDKTNDNRDVLSLAIAGNCSIQTMALLIVNGAATNVVDEHKRSLLHQAVLKDNVLLLDFLFQHTNINLNLLDNMGNTCVHLATQYNSRRCLTYLVSQGAIVNSRNKEGRLPEAIAAAQENEEMINFIHTITGPPSIVTSLSTYKGKKSECIVNWEYPNQPTYAPRIEAVEIQIKQNKLFDSWKTVGTIRGSDRAATESDRVLQLKDITFDKKCGTIEGYSQETLDYIESHKDAFDFRKVNPKQWNLPENEFVLKDIQASTSYVIKIRLANKYKFGEYSASFPVELKHRSSTKQEEKPESNPEDSSELDLSSSSEDTVKKQEKKKKKSRKGKGKSKKRSEKIEKEVSSDVSEKEEEVEKEVKVVESEPTPETSSKTDDSDTILNTILKEGTDYLLQQVTAGVNIAKLRSHDGYSLMHMAVVHNNIKLVEYLLLNNILSVNECTRAQVTPLHLAPTVEMISFLLDHQADIMARDDNGLTPFLQSCSQNDIERVQLYISRMTPEQLNTKDKQNRNAIMIAIIAGNLPIVSLLAAKGVDINYQVPSQGWNALFYAIQNKNKDIAKFCLECGIPPSVRNQNGMSPLDYCQEQGYFELTQLLNNYTSTPSVIQNIDVSILNDEAVLTIQLPEETKQGPLFEFQELEITYKKNAFLAQSKQLVIDLKTTTTENGVVIVKLEDLAPSTSYQSKVRISNRNGFSQWSKNVEIDMNESESESESESNSESEPKHETTKSPIKKRSTKTPTPSPSDSSDSSDSEPETPQPEAITEEVKPVVSVSEQPNEVPTLPEEKKVYTAEEIIELVADANVDQLAKVDPSILPTVRTPLNLPLVHTAILSKNSGKKIREVLKLLITAKCSLTEEVDTEYCNQLSPILCSCLLDDTTVLEYLLHMNCKLPSSKLCGISSALFYSMLASTSCVLEFLLTRENSIPKGDKNRSLLHILATMNKRSNNEDIILLLLAKGISIDCVDEDGNTPLHLCSLYGNTQLVSLLIMKGASLIVQNKNNETPLDVAVNLNNSLMVDAFATVLEVPQPPGNPEVHLCLDNCLEIRWKEPMRRDCVPEVLYYEVEGVDAATGTVYQLSGNHIQTNLITSLDIPRSVQIHVRAKNVNGWSQWSNFGYVMDIHTDCRWNNDLFVWLYYHSLEQYYNRVVEFGVTSIEELVKMSSNDIGKLKLKPIHEKALLNIVLYTKSKTETSSQSTSTKENRLSWFRK